MLSITAVSAGAIDYLLRGSGCADHEHGAEADQSPAQAPGAEYLLSSSKAEPAGVWFGAGLSMVGVAEGAVARESDVRAVFGQLRHPTSTEDDPLFLGRAPRTFAAVEERIERACSAEPDAGPERRREIALRVRADRRKAVAYYDLTFAPVKSVSVYWAALTSAGRHAEADRVVAAHREAIAEAMAWAEAEVAWTRVGYHGRTASGRSVGRYESGEGLVWTRWDHSTNRACEPQLHSHVAVLNRVITTGDGQIRALDGRGFRAVKHGIDAIYAQAYEQKLTEWFGVRFEWRPDGRAREILGIDPRLLIEASSRRQDVVAATEKLVAEYQQRHGSAPSPATRSKLARMAALSTRDGKSALAPGQQVRRWCAPRLARLRHSLSQAEHCGTGRDQRNPPDWSIEEVVAAAVDAVQADHATWDVGLLQRAIAEQLTRTPCVVAESLPALTERVLVEPARFGIAQVSAPDPIPVPAELRRTDGKSRYRPHHDERYTTTAQLGVEAGIVVAARTPGAPALAPAALAHIRKEIDSAGLSADQASAVIGILGSARSADVLVGPAGTGKSHTVGVLADVWRRRVGGRVIGLATSQIAAMELADNGLEAMNTTRFLTALTPDGPGFDQIRRGDLVVVDEVGMTSTAEIAAISRLVSAAGGKLLYTGDQEQLAAIGAGGMLALLVADNGCFELTETHRFNHDWERVAAIDLRTGDTSALDAYERNGRLVGGSVEDLSETAVRAYLADNIAGRRSLLVVGSNSQATELSARIHDELVRLGRVQPHVLATTRDGNLISAGDLIQARRNDSSIPVDGAGMVTNRVTYRVLGHHPHTGELRVIDPEDRVAHLPARYVAEHVTLAYATTVYAAQGRTVDTCHALVEPGADRRSVYVALTRGRETNTAYVVCERDADGHLPERLSSTARAQLAAAVALVDHDGTHAAEAVRRAGLSESRSLNWVATQWDLVTAELCGQLCTSALSTACDPAMARTLLTEPGYPRLARAVRAAQLAGHDINTLLTEAVSERSLLGANSVSDVLRWRLSIATGSRAPEHDTSSSGWVGMTPASPRPVGEYALALAELAQTRQQELGERAAAERPAWAVHHLGPPPTRPDDRREWTRRSGEVAAYRDLAGLPDDAVGLGPAPPREQVLHRTMWQRAHTASGAPTDELDYTTATESQLRQMRATYERELDWAPHWVHDELRDAQLAATGYQRDARLWHAEAELLPAGSAERARADNDVHAAQQLAATYTARVEFLREIDTARRHWHHDTESARSQHEHAGVELDRRGLPRDRIPVTAEQIELIGELSVHERQLDRPAEGGAPRMTQSGPDQQEPLFDLAPEARDLAAAQPLLEADSGTDGSTLAEAHRRSQVSADLKAQHNRWRATVDELIQSIDKTREHDDLASLQRSHDIAPNLTGEHVQDLDLGDDYQL